MRALFLFFVLANTAFFAWANFVSDGDTQSDPRPLARQVAPEKLRVLPPAGAGRAAPTPNKPAADAPAPQAAASRTQCLEMGGFAAADVTRVGEALTPFTLGARLSQRQVDDTASWWVFIPPRGTRPDAQKKAAELKALGVDDLFILQDEGPQRYALSLGVFKTEAAATSRLEALRAKGVRTAQVGARETTLQKTYLQVRAVDEPLAAQLREIAQTFTGVEVRECPAPRAP